MLNRLRLCLRIARHIGLARKTLCAFGVLFLMTFEHASAVAQTMNMFGRTTSGEPGSANVTAPVAAPLDAAPHPSAMPGWLRVVIGKGIRYQGELNEMMQDALFDQDSGLDPRAAFTLILLSFAYGVLHALGSGHGKTVVGTYLMSHPARVRESLMLGIWSAAAQALSAIVLVAGAAMIARNGMSGLLTRAANLEIVSYAALLGVGLWTAWSIATRRDCCQIDRRTLAPFRQTLTARTGTTDDAPSANAVYLGTTLAGHRRRRSFATSPQARSQRAIARQIFLTGLAVGIRPCAGALFVLIAALEHGLFGMGIVSTLAMGMGVAVTVCTIGLASMGINRKLVMQPSSKRAALMNARRIVALGGACLITAFAAWQLLALVAGWSATALV